MTIRILAVALSVAALGAIGAGSASAATAQPAASCASGDRFIGTITTTNLSCAKAKSIAQAWARTGACFRGSSGISGVRACTVQSYRCTPTRKRSFSARITCTRGSRVARWTARN